MVSFYPLGVTYDQCIILESPTQDGDRQPLLPLAPAEPTNILCALPNSFSDSFLNISGTDNCFG